MKVYALLSWYDESPEHLTRCVRSLEGFADCLVALDGAYATFPDAKPESPAIQKRALHDAAYSCGLEYKITAPYWPWSTEVEKRAMLFDLGRSAGATSDDWFLIIDGDMALGEFTPDARAKLGASEKNAAEVRWHDLMLNGMPVTTNRFRSMFRALPGLTVERTHYLYTVPQDGAPTGRRFLWHEPSGRLSDEPTLDLFEDVTLHHFNSQRDSSRRQRALAYYKDRDDRTLESAGDWRGA